MVGREVAVRCMVLGTDTGVGKSMVVASLVEGLRAAGRRVWIHKPVACGDWADGQAEDGRHLATLVGDGQDPTTVCPWQFPMAAAPHVAARAVGVTVSLADLEARLAALLPGTHDLVVEGAGGILAPLTVERGTAVDLLLRHPLPVVLVTRPHLGTINHTWLSVRHLLDRGITVWGMVINHHEAVDLADPAIAYAAEELAACCQVPVLGVLPFRPSAAQRQAVAGAVLRASVGQASA